MIALIQIIDVNQDFYVEINIYCKNIIYCIRKDHTGR
jgi:hypothetical protein